MVNSADRLQWNLAIPILELTAQITVIGFYVGAAMEFYMTSITGFNKFLGLMPFIGPGNLLKPILPLDHLSSLDSNYHLWLIASILVSTVSIFADLLDLIKYRQQHLAGNP